MCSRSHISVVFTLVFIFKDTAPMGAVHKVDKVAFAATDGMDWFGAGVFTRFSIYNNYTSSLT